ncbi:MAG: hypothetical protein SH808_09325 [Saprospiraceae bacterium]|nr:hypothetical protein [Saprospiraceae bacterium]
MSNRTFPPSSPPKNYQHRGNRAIGRFLSVVLIQEGEIVAQNEHGPITSPVGGLILMPKYQSLGDDGFFVVAVVE